jgi:hypothetical protein
MTPIVRAVLRSGKEANPVPSARIPLPHSAANRLSGPSRLGNGQDQNHDEDHDEEKP